MPNRRGSGPTFALIIPPAIQQEKKWLPYLRSKNLEAESLPLSCPPYLIPPSTHPLPLLLCSISTFITTSSSPLTFSLLSPSLSLSLSLPLFYSSSHTPSSVSFTMWEVKRKRRKRKDRRIYGGGELQIKTERQKKKDVLSYPICVSESKDMNPEPLIRQTDAN